MQRESIELFATIADCSTWGEACTKTGMKEDDLHAAVSKLEEEVGHPLLSPPFTNIKITRFGKVLRNNAERISNDFAQMERAMERVAKQQAHRIGFGCFATTHSFMVLPQVAHALPDMDFKVIVCAARDIVSGLQNVRMDIAILPQTAVPEGMASFEIGEEQAYLSVPYTSSLALNDKITLEEVAAEPMYVVSDLYGLSQWYEEIYEAAGGDFARLQRQETAHYLSEMNDTPCSHFSSSIMQLLGSSSSGRVEIPIDAEIAHRKIVVAYDPKNAERLARVIDFLKQNKDALYTSRAFLPHLMHPGRIHNLDAPRTH